MSFAEIGWQFTNFVEIGICIIGLGEDGRHRFGQFSTPIQSSISVWVWLNVSVWVLASGNTLQFAYWLTFCPFIRL